MHSRAKAGSHAGHLARRLFLRACCEGERGLSGLLRLVLVLRSALRSAATSSRPSSRAAATTSRKTSSSCPSPHLRLPTSSSAWRCAQCARLAWTFDALKEFASVSRSLKLLEVQELASSRSRTRQRDGGPAFARARAFAHVSAYICTRTAHAQRHTSAPHIRTSVHTHAHARTHAHTRAHAHAHAPTRPRAHVTAPRRAYIHELTRVFPVRAACAPLRSPPPRGTMVPASWRRAPPPLQLAFLSTERSVRPLAHLLADFCPLARSFTLCFTVGASNVRSAERSHASPASHSCHLRC
eukprot:3205464-Pleurochrysis_carterae.AAC.2